MPLITDKAPFAIDFTSSPSRNCCDSLVAITSYNCNAWFTYTKDTSVDTATDLSYIPNNNPTSCDPASVTTSDNSVASIQLPYVNKQSLFDLCATMYLQLGTNDFDTFIPNLSVEEDLKKYVQSLPLIVNSTVPTTARLRVVQKIVSNDTVLSSTVLASNDVTNTGQVVWNNNEQGIYITVA